MAERTAMDKFTVNNQVVKMRGVVSRAKVVVIRKLVRKARQLENKDKEKFERLLKDIIAVKKQSPDRISKFALENKKCLSDCMSDGLHISADDRALYRLAIHPYVVNEVAKFRKMYRDWEKELPMILRVLGVKVKKKQKKEKYIMGHDDSADIEERKSTRLKTQTQGKRKEEKYIIGGNDSADIEECKSTKPKTQTQEKQKKEKHIIEDDDSADIEERKSTKHKVQTQKKQKKLVSDESSLDNREEQESKKPRRKEEKANGHCDTAEIIYLNLSDLMCEELPVTTSQHNSETVAATKHKKLSSFFLGGELSDDDNTSSIKTENTMEGGEVLNRKQRRNLLFGREVNYSKWPKKEQKQKQIKQFYKQQPEIKREESVTKTAHEEPKLHPSWAAKKQQTQVVVPFMGKKIKFDDD